MKNIRKVGIGSGLLLALAGLTAFYEPRLVIPGFDLIRKSIDLESRTAIPSLVRGFIIIRSPRYAGVIHTKNKGTETAIQFPGLSDQRYVVKFKVRFFSRHQQIALDLNGHPIGTAVPKQASVAQKYVFLVGPGVLRQDINTFRCVHSGVDGPVDYELLELRNYRSASRAKDLILYFDGPWIGRAIRQAERAPLLAKRIFFWVSFYLVWAFFLGWILHGALPALWERLLWVHVLSLAAGSFIHSICFMVSLLGPYTLRLTSTWFLGCIIAPSFLIVPISFAIWSGQTIWNLMKKHFVPDFATRLEADLAQTIGILQRCWVVLFHCTTGPCRWFCRNPGRQGLLSFISISLTASIFLMFGGNSAAEILVDIAYFFLIASVWNYGIAAMGSTRKERQNRSTAKAHFGTPPVDGRPRKRPSPPQRVPVP